MCDATRRSSTPISARNASGPRVLDVQDLVVRYGEATALDGVNLRVERGEMVALIGPNGAGKSTLLNTVCGLLRPAGGGYRLDGRVAQVPEGRQLFASMTVE